MHTHITQQAWADRWAGNKTLVPMDEFYVGWMVVGNWFRITVDVQQPVRLSYGPNHRYHELRATL